MLWTVIASVLRGRLCQPETCFAVSRLVGSRVSCVGVDLVGAPEHAPLASEATLGSSGRLGDQTMSRASDGVFPGPFLIMAWSLVSISP